jgi:hypothetical protein
VGGWRILVTRLRFMAVMIGNRMTGCKGGGRDGSRQNAKPSGCDTRRANVMIDFCHHKIFTSLSRIYHKPIEYTSQSRHKSSIDPFQVQHKFTTGSALV